MKGPRSAMAFLTILPVKPGPASALASARMWFPVVGLLLGSILAVLDLSLRWGYQAGAMGLGPSDQGSYPVFLSVLVVLALVFLTRALHLDGFMDTCDAFFGDSHPQRRLQILKDPHVGAFAVVGVVCLLLLKVTALTALPAPSRAWMLILFPCLSRWAILLSMELFPYARSQGLGVAFLQRRTKAQVLLGLAVTLLAAVGLVGPWGLMMVALASLLAWAIGAWATRLLGGMTGDVYGAVNETVEVCALLLAALLVSADPAVLSPPFGIAMASSP